MLGASITPSLLVLAPRGEARELVTFEAAFAAASAAGELGFADAIREEAEYETPPPAPRCNHEAERKALTGAGAEALPKILDAFAQLPEVELWRWIASTLARADADGLGDRIEQAAARRELKPSAADDKTGTTSEPLAGLLAWIEEARTGGARMLALELLITSWGVEGDLDEGHPFASPAKIACVDFEAMRRAAFTAAGLPLA